MSLLEQILPSQSLLKSRYKIIKEIGRGGMGVVYLAEDLELLSRPVVIKILFDEAQRDEVVKRKFRQEMEALARIDHPGVVGILDAGELPDGKPFLVMQYIEGVSLRSILKPGGIEYRKIAELLSQIGSSLHAAHRKGIFHRDLKPENIMIQNLDQETEQIKLIDFGLAKVIDSKVAESSQYANVVGSFGYMSPEQLTAKPVTAASDVYSLGVIAYEMITGSRPFNPESVFELHEFQRKGAATNPSMIREGLPQNAEAIVLKALEFQPDQRYSSAREFTDQLSKALVSTQTDTPVPAPSKKEQPRIFLWRIAVFASTLVLISAFVLLLKLSFFRFVNWRTFLFEPYIILTILPLAIVYQVKVPKTLLVLNCLAIAVLSYFIKSIPEVITFPNSSNAAFTLNYSDPKGYRYTLVNVPCIVNINPGRWNHLSDYTIQLSLSPHIEFADVYFDQQFQMHDQLALQPSNTNDILVTHKEGDDFSDAREMKFTYKYRTYQPENEFTVTLKAGNTETSRIYKIHPPKP